MIRFFFFALAFSAVCRAQQQPLKLTLVDAERLAIQNNPQLSVAQLTAAASHQVPVEVRANTAPVLMGNITGVGADSGSRLAAGGLNNPVVFNRLASGLNASKLITDFGRTRELVQSSELHAQAQDQLTETARADILIATIRAYFGVLRANAIAKVARQTVSARQLLTDQVTALFRNQLKSQLDVSFANVNLADARLLESQAQNDVQSSEASLAAVLGVPSQAFTLADEPLPGPLEDQVDPLVRQALENRPELKSLRLEQAAAERFAKAEHALNYPTIAAAGAAGFVPAGEATVPGRYGAVGLNVNIPILNGGLFRARQSEAELKARAITSRLNDLTNFIARDVRIAYLGARTAFARVDLTNQLLQQAQSSLDLAQGRYDLGLGSIVELSQAQLNLTSAQIANAAAKFDYQAQIASVDYQTGSLR